MRTFRLPTVCGSVATRCQYWRGSSSEQIWTGFQSWPPDVTCRGRGRARRLATGSLYSKVPCPGGVWGQQGVTSKGRGRARRLATGSLYSKVPCPGGVWGQQGVTSKGRGRARRLAPGSLYSKVPCPGGLGPRGVPVWWGPMSWGIPVWWGPMHHG